MRYIDMETWPRRRLFAVYATFDHPHFGMCANVDVTAFYPAVKQRSHSVTLAIVYVITRAANAIPEFRYRIHGQQVVEHDAVRPSTTILAKDDLFSFCYFEYVEDFSAFADRAAARIAYMREHPTVENEPGDDALYMTAIPWVSFTSFMHPMHLQPADSVPRFAWGKFFQDGDLLKMPLAVQGHHALMDGQHVGQFYAELQDYLDHPASVLGEV
jgi:chloramphenicol O-acetyltransferase type A